MTKLDKIKYSFLKELEENENRMVEGREIVIPKKEDYNLDDEAYGNLILYLEDEGYITAKYARAKDIPVIVMSANITESGKEYLKSNSALGKLYKGIKEIKDFIPGL